MPSHGIDQAMRKVGLSNTRPESLFVQWGDSPMSE
jgi:hypothetical protein